jgi:hypothetical protein
MNGLLFLLILPLLAKISLAFVPGFPSEFGFLIFQYGLHPYVNVALCLLVAGYLMFKEGRKIFGFHRLPKVYIAIILTTICLLLVQSVLQSLFGEERSSLIMQLAAAGSSSLMILIYGCILPTQLDIVETTTRLRKWIIALVLLSLVLYFISPGTSFKGGRFIGVFKHIPHMVTAATLASFLFAERLWKSSTFGQFVLRSLGWGSSIVAVILTGTRSSLMAAAGGLLLGGLIYRAPAKKTSFIKWSLGGVLAAYLLLFGVQTGTWLYGIATGQESLAGREAQDGVQSRWEEVERGIELFQKDPWLGLGLLSKFSQGGEADVSSYNSFKDPHNIFISAGVIGGWPFIVWTALMLLFLIWAATKHLLSGEILDSYKTLGLFLFCHYPILIIYHWHLSLGGMADRYYWLSVGVIAVTLEKIMLAQRKKA